MTTKILQYNKASELKAYQNIIQVVVCHRSRYAKSDVLSNISVTLDPVYSRNRAQKQHYLQFFFFNNLATRRTIAGRFLLKEKKQFMKIEK